MDVIPLNGSLVRGSHGRITDHVEDGPMLIVDRPELLKRDSFAATDVKSLLLDGNFQ
jgi:hypothetical protein